MTLETLARCCVCTLLVGIALAESGCRRRDPYTDGVLEITRAEKIDLEDQIYALEDKLAQRERELAALRARVPLGPVPRTRAVTPAPPDVLDDSQLMPPSIDPGIPVEPKIELPPIDPAPVPGPALELEPRPASRPPVRSLKPEPAPEEAALEESSPANEPPADVPDEELTPPNLPSLESEALPEPDATPSFRRPPADAELIDPQVSNLFINPFHTAGVELDQQPGDDGLMILFEPRNASGQYVPQAGEVTIVVLDPAQEGEAARVARWELTKTEVSQRMLDARPERGIKAELKWPDKRPEHAKLKMFVRYHTTDGRQVEARSDVFVTLPGQISQRWTPRRE